MRNIRGTGIHVDIPGPLASTLPVQVPGEHLWMVTGAWQIDPRMWGNPMAEVHLDSENLLTIAGPGCYWCEKLYAPELFYQRCPGEQKGIRP